MTQDEKGKVIGRGSWVVSEDDSHCEWACGCYEDQHGYHLCVAHLRDNNSRDEATATNAVRGSMDEPLVSIRDTESS